MTILLTLNIIRLKVCIETSVDHFLNIFLAKINLEQKLLNVTRVKDKRCFYENFTSGSDIKECTFTILLITVGRVRKISNLFIFQVLIPNFISALN